MKAMSLLMNTPDHHLPKTDADADADAHRRAFLIGPVAMACSALTISCGGGSSAASGSVNPPVSPLPDGGQPTPVVTPLPEVKGKYRYQQPLLFQGTAGPLPSVLPGGTPYVDGLKCGPTQVYVDSQAGWPWNHRGGDWKDADGVSQGPKPWASWTQPGLMVVGETMALTMDITRMAQRGSWIAMLLRCPRAQRKIKISGSVRPTLTYTYDNGTIDVQTATVTAFIGDPGELPKLLLDPMPMPAVLEFRRPTRAVTKAVLALVMTEGQWASTGGPAQLEVFPLTPPIHTDAATFGLAQHHVLDEGLAAQPGVIHVHRYLSNSALPEFVHQQVLNTDDEANFDPHLIDPTLPEDRTRLPHAGYGKWVGDTAAWAMARADDVGYEPLHPGLGAIRVSMKRASFTASDGRLRPIQDGDLVGYGGSLSSHAFLFLPPERIYRQRRLFVRHYMRLTYPNGKPQPNDRKQVYTDRVGGQVKWSDLGGKFGLTPGGHHNTVGGYSGSAGAGRGTQFRSGWVECTEGIDGPGENGWYVSWHLFDYNSVSIPGHVYAASPKSGYCWGQRGGLGGVLYADHWYCVELECLLNSVDQPAVLADGSPHVVNGVRQHWSPDGELRAWIDGRLAFERTGMAFRSLPVVPTPFRPGYSRPIAPLGHVYAGMNIFHGGVTQECLDRYLDITGVVVSEARIGPMRFT